MFNRFASTIPKYLFALAAIGLISACGGGGSSDSGARFSVSSSTVTFEGAVDGGQPQAASLRGTVTGADEPVYVIVDASQTALVADAYVEITGTTGGTLTIIPTDPDLLGEGNHQGQIQVRVCYDPGCSRQLSGSPQTITVNYNVIVDPNILDSDDDGAPDVQDAFPNDPTESLDTDNDGIGNNTDTDDDNDGVADQDDAFPLDNTESVDTDGDLIGDNTDTDDDNDGIADDIDAAPLDNSVGIATTTIYINLNGSAHVSVNGQSVQCVDSCETQIDNLTEPDAEIRIEAQEHFTFVSWGHPQCSDDFLYSCNLGTRFEQSLTLDVSFDEDPYMTVSANSTDNGSIFQEFGPAQCSGSCETKIYGNMGETINLVAVSKPGYQFDAWSGECNGGGECSFPWQEGANLNISASFTDSSSDFDLCPGDADLVLNGSNDVSLGATGDYIPLCNGHVILTELTANQILVMDVINETTTHTFQLSASPDKLALDEENKLLYVSHNSVSYVSRINLRTGEVAALYIKDGAQSVAVSDDGTLFVSLNEYQGMRLIDSLSGVSLLTNINVSDQNISYNDATSRLIGRSRNYFYDAVSNELTLQGPSSGGGSGSDCDKVVVSPDGDHAALACGGGNGQGYSIFNFYSHDPQTVFGEWITGAYPSGAAFAPSNEYVLLTNRSQLQLFDVDTHTLVHSHDPVQSCGYEDLRRMGVSTDGKLLFGLTQCGFDNDSARLTWVAYDTNE